MPNHSFKFFDSSFSTGIRLRSFNDYLKYESKSNNQELILVDFDLNNSANDQKKLEKLALSQVIPVCFHGGDPELGKDWRVEEFISGLVGKYETWAKAAKMAGHETIVLSIDEDCLLQQFLTPRFKIALSLSERLKIIVLILQKLQESIENVGVALTVEELCPGGLDATDGQKIAQILVQNGAALILTNAGTADFPALKLRRPTKLRQQSNLETPMFELASCLWLKDVVNIPLLFQTNREFGHETINLAKAEGIRGIISIIV